MKQVLREGKALQKAYGADRVTIIDVADLSQQGPLLLQRLGAGNIAWDPKLGRNTDSNRLLSKMAARKLQAAAMKRAR